MTDDAERLEPCPWCGEVPGKDSYALRDGGYKYGGIVCGCGAQGPDVRTDYYDWPHWKAAAIAAWNRRATAGAPAPTYQCEHVRVKQMRDGNIMVTMIAKGFESAPRYAVRPINPAVVRASASPKQEK